MLFPDSVFREETPLSEAWGILTVDKEGPHAGPDQLRRPVWQPYKQGDLK